MSTTFKCWLIANFEIVFFWIVFIAGGIWFFRSVDRIPMLPIFVPSATFIAAFTFPTKKGSIQFGKYFVMIGFGIFFTYLSNQPVATEDEMETVMILKKIMSQFWIVLPIASVISLFLAVYTYRHVDEVISRRMLYRNSRVSLFEYSWRYTLERFCSIAVATVIFIVWILSMQVVSEYLTIEYLQNLT
jgi:hypothetical protein